VLAQGALPHPLMRPRTVATVGAPPPFFGEDVWEWLGKTRAPTRRENNFARPPRQRGAENSVERKSQAERTRHARTAKKPQKRRHYKTHFTAEEETARRQAAFAAIKRLYAEVLPVSSTCPRGHCRRHQRCFGNLGPCLERVWPQMPPEVQERAYNQVKAGGPRQVPPATSLERGLRRFPATNFVH
jgi:hypothetical protein